MRRTLGPISAVGAMAIAVAAWSSSCGRTELDNAAPRQPRCGDGVVDPGRGVRRRQRRPTDDCLPSLPARAAVTASCTRASSRATTATASTTTSATVPAARRVRRRQARGRRGVRPRPGQRRSPRLPDLAALRHAHRHEPPRARRERDRLLRLLLVQLAHRARAGRREPHLPLRRRRHRAAQPDPHPRHRLRHVEMSQPPSIGGDGRRGPAARLHRRPRRRPHRNPPEFQATGPDTADGRWGFNINSDGGVLGGLPFPGDLEDHRHAELHRASPPGAGCATTASASRS